jgi:hypothetical protein
MKLRNFRDDDVVNPIGVEGVESIDDAIEADWGLDESDLYHILDSESDSDENPNAISKLKWKSIADTNLRSCVYTGNSTRTARRNKKRKKELSEPAKQFRDIRTMFGNPPGIVKDQITEMIGKKFEKRRLDIVMESLLKLKETPRNQILAKKSSDITKFDYTRSKAVYHYFDKLLMGAGLMEASEDAQIHTAKGSHQARLIRNWASHYYEHLTLPVYRQGRCHI